ncbi:unnamed protein product [Clavelina lepadiformis]|uniref:Taste receptor type 2 n=1 Tax=Clavelina lepadiformis TaxID=159417 RepID=A0ABP0GM74_CLALP
MSLYNVIVSRFSYSSENLTITETTPQPLPTSPSITRPDSSYYPLSTKICACALTAGSTYLTMTLAWHAMRTWRQAFVSKVNHLCLFSSFATTLFCLNTLLMIWSQLPMQVLAWMHGAFYWISISLTYTILWARQRKFYSDDLLSRNITRCHKVMSSLVIFVIYLCFGGVVISFQLKMNSSSWISLGGVDNILPVGVLLIFICFVSQFILLFLLVNPLIGEDNTTLCEILRFKLKKDIHKMVVRLAFCALVCIFTTIITSAIVLLNSAKIINIFWGHLVALDLLINSVTTVCTFANWKQKFFPYISFHE